MPDRNLLTASDGFNRCILGREGYIVYNKNDMYGGAAIERYGEDSEIEMRILRQMCAPGGVVVDVGAHIGARTVPLSRRVGPTGFVYAYEPQRIVFQTLCANLALNSIVNVEARCAAVGACQGYVQVPNIDYSRRANFGCIAVRPANAPRGVPQVRLDEDLDLTQLNLLKVDVEGMEREVLLGADGLIRRFQPALYVENDRLEKSEMLVRHLMSLDYRLYWHQPKLFNAENFFGATENILPNMVSVNLVCLPRAAVQTVVGLQEVKDATEHPMRRP
jgi:FkbM family methyltransferase